MRSYKLGNFDTPWIQWAEARAPKPCSWPECTSSAKSMGFCQRDYTRAYRRGNFTNPWDEWQEPGRPCIWPECERSAESRELCDKHYVRARKLQDFETPWIGWASLEEMLDSQRRTNSACTWPDCKNISRCRNLCAKHYERAKSVGDFESPWLSWNLPRPCERCGEEFQREQSTARFCSANCSLKSYAERNPEAVRKRMAEWKKRYPDKHRMKEHRRRAQKRATETRKFSELDVRLASGDTCYLCGVKVNFRLKHPNPKSPSLDHVIALSRGGTHTLGNVAMTHLDCNVRKNAKQTTRVPQPTLFAL